MDNISSEHIEEGELTPGAILPDWAVFLLDFGAWLHKTNASGRLVSGALILPTIQFSTVFVLAGYVLESERSRSLRDEGEFDADAHFAKIKSLPIGTPVRVWDGDDSIVGIIDGVESKSDQHRLKIYISDFFRDTFELQHVKRITFFSEKELRVIRKLRAGDSVPENLSALFLLGVEPGVIKGLHDGARMEAIVVGIQSKIWSELTCDLRPILEISSSKDVCLQQITRTVGASQSISSRRSKILPARRTGQGLASADDHPMLLFEGASSFIAYEEQIDGNSWLLVADPFDPRLEDAINRINEHFVVRDGDLDFSGFPEPIKGIEAVLFSGGER